MPNIEESITVQLGGPAQEEMSNTSIVIMTDEDLQRKTAEEYLVETNKTQRRDGGHMDASKEVRNLLEFLFLDVKVRSPAEVSVLTFRNNPFCRSKN